MDGTRTVLAQHLFENTIQPLTLAVGSWVESRGTFVVWCPKRIAISSYTNLAIASPVASGKARAMSQFVAESTATKSRLLPRIVVGSSPTKSRCQQINDGTVSKGTMGGMMCCFAIPFGKLALRTACDGVCNVLAYVRLPVSFTHDIQYRQGSEVHKSLVSFIDDVDS
jgi:hypothetical protein